MGSITAEPLSEAFTIKEQWHSQPTHLRVIGSGAGASGLCLAYKMFHHFKLENVDLVIYEKNPGVGGTWYENRYPGCACDIPAHAYTYSFEPNPDWSTFYAYGPEIKGYFERFADKYDLRKYIKLKSRVISAVWDEQQGIYNIEIDFDGQRVRDWCHVFVNGTGFLNDWKWPNIQGLHDFQGQLVHSANWDESVDWKGKRVGVIGTGSSAIQIVPQIQKTAQHLVAFMRSVTWISPPVGGEMLEAEQKKFQKNGEESTTKPQAQYYYTEEDKKNFRENPQAHLEYRRGLEGAANTLFDIFIKDSEASRGVEVLMRSEMHRRIGPGHEELKEKLIPQWPPGCRRITPGDGYLEALVQPNVTPIHHEIAKVTPTGILDASGTHHDLDILVCATGFNLAFTPRFEVVGSNGLTMRDFFAIPEGPQVYLATTVPNFPNYFVVNGVRGNWASGPAPPAIEICTEYIVRCCRKMQTEQLHSLTVRQDPVTQLYEYMDAWHARSVWSADCKSWYKNNILGAKLWVWAGSGLHFMKSLQGEPKFEHYDLKYKNRNMWAFLGNGRTKPEMLKGTEGYAQGKELLAKLSPYIRNADVPFQVD